MAIEFVVPFLDMSAGRSASRWTSGTDRLWGRRSSTRAGDVANASQTVL
jgi:hypothetical protein